MITTTATQNAASLKSSYSVTQHSIYQTILLHLLPGALITLAFILLGPWLQHNHFPPILALLLPILLVLIPFELGWLIVLGYRRNGRLSLDGIVLNRQPLPLKDYLLFVPILMVWAAMIFMGLSRVDQSIFTSIFAWLPDWFLIDQFTPALYSQPILIFTFALFLVLNGLAGPIVEELYFRGYLLPRMEYLGGRAPLVNVVLFSLYHFFSPWQFFTRILAFYPLAYAVRWKSNIYLSIISHCLLNIGFCLLTAPSFF